jgi:hypothetical protein
VFAAGDIVEHERGRWKGRRLIVVGMTRLGAVDVKDGKGNFTTILNAPMLRVVRLASDNLFGRWLRIWHRSTSRERRVIRNALRKRRLHKHYGPGPHLEKIEWFLNEYLKFADGVYN